MFWATAFAQATSAAPAASAAAKPSILESFFPLIAIFFVFYFLFMRPQSKQRQEHAKVLAALKKGDQVLTSSGILGRIDGLTDKYVTLEVAANVKIKLLRNQVAGLAKEKENE